MKVKVLKTGVTLDNAVIDVGAEVEVPDNDGNRLIKSGYVKAVKSTKPPKDQGGEPPENKTE